MRTKVAGQIFWKWKNIEKYQFCLHVNLFECQVYLHVSSIWMSSLFAIWFTMNSSSKYADVRRHKHMEILINHPSKDNCTMECCTSWKRQIITHSYLLSDYNSLFQLHKPSGVSLWTSEWEHSRGKKKKRYKPTQIMLTKLCDMNGRLIYKYNYGDIKYLMYKWCHRW